LAEPVHNEFAWSLVRLHNCCALGTAYSLLRGFGFSGCTKGGHLQVKAWVTSLRLLTTSLLDSVST